MPAADWKQTTAVDDGWIDFRLGFQPAFNGLRGIAVFSVMVFHGIVTYEGRANRSFLQGGFLGLEIFFVQSGFLIASLLLEEWYRTGAISLRRFYARRALRLFPALFVLIGVTAFWLLTFSPYKGEPGPWREVWTALLYVQNWFTALNPIAIPSYLNQLWSLSIEEQFYLVAPLLLLLGLRLGLSARRLVPYALGAALLSTGWMAVFARQAHSATQLARPYYGTDTRAQALLIGVTLALAMHSGRWWQSERTAKLTLVWAWAGAIGIGVMLATVGIKRRATYEGILLICDLSVAGILTETIRHPRGVLARLLSWKPLERSGAISYGLYLWHWPLMFVVQQYVHWAVVPQIAFEIALTFPVALTSYYLLERPLITKLGGRFRRISAERELRSVATAVESATS